MEPLVFIGTEAYWKNETGAGMEEDIVEHEKGVTTEPLKDFTKFQALEDGQVMEPNAVFGLEDRVIVRSFPVPQPCLDEF